MHTHKSETTYPFGPYKIVITKCVDNYTHVDDPDAYYEVTVFDANDNNLDVCDEVLEDEDEALAWGYDTVYRVLAQQRLTAANFDTSFDEDEYVSRGPEGAWVEATIWVPNPNLPKQGRQQ